MDSKTHLMASMEEGNIDGQNENKKSRLLQAEHESVEVPAMKTHLGSSFVFAREIRPKEIMSGHNLGDPPMKKSKTEQPGPNVQNGFPGQSVSTMAAIHHNPSLSTSAPMMNMHNNMSIAPSNPLSKLHELNKNIISTSFSTSSKTSSSSFASIVHSDGPNLLFPNGVPVVKKPVFSSGTINGKSSPEVAKENGKHDVNHSSTQKTTESENSSSSNGVPVEGQNDALSSLEWKDGIADLPGSKLKFKMTEFGLEIISTVDTEDGEVEFSTPTSGDQNVKKDAMSNQPEGEKDNRDDKGSSSKKLLEGPPDSHEFCCCEICGKYGLRSEFGASGRFCGLTCVGVYTGRRNKGREMSRHVKAFDGKIIKRKKRKGRKLTVIKQSSINGV